MICNGDGGGCLEEIVVTGERRESSPGAITNNQEEGVDEGDIVKRVGEYIVLLRRGRLFTFALPTSSNQLKAVAYIDVAPQDEDIDAWYDEILSYENTIVLLGFSYELNASLVRLFKVAANGELSPGKSYFFKSSDYYDFENYATRLVNGNLVIYMPRELSTNNENVTSGQLINGEPVNMGSAFANEIIYQPIQQSNYPILHTVATCPLNADEIKCTATSFVAPSSQLFYVSDDAVYLWINSAGRAYNYFLMSDRYVRYVAITWQDIYDESGDLAVIYRVPFNGSVPSLVEAKGWPINQFSFRETQNSLQVFARDSEWGSGTQPNILDIPLILFGPQITKLPESQYQYLPPFEGEGSLTVNRFVGSNLLYSDLVGTNIYDYRSYVLVKDMNTDLPPVRFQVNHLVERIEPVNDIAAVIGSNRTSGLGITPIGTGNNPVFGQTLWINRAVQADERSHSFNYRQNGSMNVIGFPVIYSPEGEQYDYWPDRASDVHMTYFGLTPDLGLQLLGEIVGHSTEDDDCKVSCSDWYGDSRPFFIDDRLYALLGYELIEAYLSGITVLENARVDGLRLLRPLN